MKRHYFCLVQLRHALLSALNKLKVITLLRSFDARAPRSQRRSWWDCRRSGLWGGKAAWESGKVENGTKGRASPLPSECSESSRKGKSWENAQSLLSLFKDPLSLLSCPFSPPMPTRISFLPTLQSLFRFHRTAEQFSKIFYKVNNFERIAPLGLHGY